MRSKILLLAGLGIGYVLGARAGRGRYEQIKRGWLSFWNSPGVQAQVHNAQEFVADKAPDVVDFVSDTAKKFVSRGDSSPAKSKSKTTRATGATGAKKTTKTAGGSTSSSTSSGTASGGATAGSK